MLPLSGREPRGRSELVRVIAGRTRIQRAGDVVDESRDLQVDVGALAPQDVGQLQVVIERAGRVDTVTVVEHREQVVDGSKRRAHG